jgi:hypothetical protein
LLGGLGVAEVVDRDVGAVREVANGNCASDACHAACDGHALAHEELRRGRCDAGSSPHVWSAFGGVDRFRSRGMGMSRVDAWGWKA